MLSHSRPKNQKLGTGSRFQRFAMPSHYPEILLELSIVALTCLGVGLVTWLTF